MSQPVIFGIDGAQTMADAEITETTIRIPEMDYTYKYGAVMGDFLLASRDGLEFVIAVTVECNGKKATRDEMVKALCS